MGLRRGRFPARAAKRSQHRWGAGPQRGRNFGKSSPDSVDNDRAWMRARPLAGEDHRHVSTRQGDARFRPASTLHPSRGSRRRCQHEAADRAAVSQGHLRQLRLARGADQRPASGRRAAIRLAPPGSRVGHHTAAELRGGVAPDDDAVHITVPSTGGRLIRRGIVSHCSREPVERQGIRHGLPVSTPIGVFFELAAAGVDLVDLVVLADSLLKAGRLSLDDLRSSADAYTGRCCRVAKRAASLARCGVDSPMETRLLMLDRAGGTPGAPGQPDRARHLTVSGIAAMTSRTRTCS